MSKASCSSIRVRFQVDSSSTLQDVGQQTVAFLTSPTLLTLQLPDATFRRQILAEIMMLLYRGTAYGAEGQTVLQRMSQECTNLLPRVRAAIDATGTSGPAFRGALLPADTVVVCLCSALKHLSPQAACSRGQAAL